MYKHILLILMLLPGIPLSAQQQDITIRGRVTDTSGQPMAGVNVVDLANPSRGVTTNREGQYAILTAHDAVLQFSFLGYASQQIAVPSKRTTLNITLQPNDLAIDEVVVIGYGTQNKSGITGAITNIDMNDLRADAITSIDEALQGRVAGLEITSNSGEPGSDATIRIRGSRSIEAGNEPLIVVDGVAGAVSSLEEINPSDIASISVLRDASSTAIYGSRGANGVIIISTVRQEPHKLSIQFLANIGFSQLPPSLDVMNAREYAVFRNDMYYWMRSLSGKPQQAGSNYAFNDPSIYGEGTDWIQAIGRTSLFQNYSVSMRGSTQNTSYYVGLGYNDTQGVIIGSGSRRYSTRFNIESKITRWLTAGVNSSYTKRDIDRNNAAIGGTNTSAAIFLVPILTTEDTWNLFGDESKTGGAVFNNPYILANAVDNIQKVNAISVTPFARIKLLPGLQLESQLSFIQNRNRYYYYSPSWLPVAKTLQTGGTARRIFYDRNNILSETMLSYQKEFDHHQIDLLGGFTAERQVLDYDYTAGTGYINDRIGYNNINGSTDSRNIDVNSYKHLLQRMSVIGRANYSYKKRYYFTFTMRADGCSAFARNNKWGFFPAGAFRWSVSNENWFKRIYWINNLALRLSAGRSGNDAISSYQSLATITTSTQGWLFGDAQSLSAYPARLENDDLTWETTDSYNIGLDLSLLKNRIVLELDGYHSVTSGLLLSVKNSQTTGYDTYFSNAGKTKNTGIEAMLMLRNLVRPKIRWTTKLTIAHNRQKTIEVGNDGRLVPTYINPRNSTQPIYGYRNGYPTNALWGYRYAGVWHNQEEIDRAEKTKAYASPTTTEPGYAKYIDRNHDGLIDANDYFYLGNSDPILFGGFQNTFLLFGALKLNIYFTYSLGGKIYNLSELWMGTGCSSSNKYRYMLDAWHPTRNPDSNIPRAYTDDGVYASDRFVHDASFLRLQNLSLGYEHTVRNPKAGIKRINFKVSCNNVWLWKRYNGFDPDVSTSSTARRVDDGAYPKARTCIFEIQLTY